MNVSKVTKVKSGKLFRAGDVIVYALLAVLILSFFLVFFSTKSGTTVAIRLGKETIKTAPLSTNAEFTVVINRKYELVDVLDGDRCDEIAARNEVSALADIWFFSHIIIRDGFVWVEHADCRDHLCIKNGKHDTLGSAIYCLPLKISVLIT